MIVSCRQLGRCGRLGNQLWQIASTIGIAYREPAARPRFCEWDYSPYFCIPRGLFGDELGIDSSTFCQHMDARFREYLQDHSMFSDCASLIREWFKPSDLALDVMDDQCGWFSDIPSPRLSIQVRRGDNVDPTSNPPGYFAVNSSEYFAECAERFPDDSIIVFSDDMPWCKTVLADAIHGRDIHFSNGVARPKEHLIEYHTAGPIDWMDLQLMARCDHHILSSGSSYSWWGAFLSDDKHPVYPKQWYGDVLSRMIDWRLIIPEGWIEVDDGMATNVRIPGMVMA